MRRHLTTARNASWCVHRASAETRRRFALGWGLSAFGFRPRFRGFEGAGSGLFSSLDAGFFLFVFAGFFLGAFFFFGARLAFFALGASRGGVDAGSSEELFARFL